MKTMSFIILKKTYKRMARHYEMSARISATSGAR
jgi:hypothetical protein